MVQQHNDGAPRPRELKLSVVSVVLDGRSLAAWIAAAAEDKLTRLRTLSPRAPTTSTQATAANDSVENDQGQLDYGLL